jgi:Arc/MetJ-type ribon-helix-helix transcriptional regulator
MIPVQIRFTKRLIEHIDKLIEHGVYSNRSEAIRDATRRLVIDLSSRNGLRADKINNSFRVIEDLKRELNGR